MIDRYGRVTSAAFIDTYSGLSVDRQWYRSISEAVNSLCNHLASVKHKSPQDFIVVSVKKKDCDKLGVLCVYSPSLNNLYHSLILESPNMKTLTKNHARQLAKVAVLESM